MAVAYCWASGHIEFGSKLPDGALPLLRGRKSVVYERVIGACRHGYRGELFVPGVPEAPNPLAALDAVRAFCARLDPARKVA